MTPKEKYTKRVPKPSPASINTGLSALPNSRLLTVIGAPASKKTNDCTAPTNAKLKKALVTESVGPFRVTGHRAAVASLRAVLADVKVASPELYALLGSAGMLCTRLVRGSSSTWSNHSWGFAVDLTIGGVLDNRGDNQVQQGLLDLYRHFRKHGWYWGAEFPTEDAMHFEVALETFNQWVKEGKV